MRHFVSTKFLHVNELIPKNMECRKLLWFFAIQTETEASRNHKVEPIMVCVKTFPFQFSAQLFPHPLHQPKS